MSIRLYVNFFFLKGSWTILSFVLNQYKLTWKMTPYSAESPKEGFNDTVFQHFADELKY